MAGSRALPARTAVARRLRPGAWWAAAVLVSAGALIVYRATMLPGLGAWDTAEAQTVPTVLGTMHPTGFPAYVVLGWLVTNVLRPLAEPATLMNFLSAVLVSLAVGMSVFVTRRLGATPILAAAIAIGFALTPIVWHIALAADAHALHLALVVGVTLGLLRWESQVRAWRASPDDLERKRAADRTIVGTAALFGVAIANHALSLLLIPAIGLFVLAVDRRVLHRPKLILAALLACFGVAALLFLELPLRGGPFRAPLVYGSPGTWDGFWDIVLARQFQNDVGGPLSDLPGKLGSLLELATQQLGPLVALVPAGFLVAAIRYPRYALYSGVAVLVTCFFAASYSNARIDRYYLGPVFFAWTWIAAFGAAIAQRILAPVAGADADAVDATAVPEGSTDRLLRRVGRPAVLVPLLVGAVFLLPTAIELKDRWSGNDLSGQTWVRGWFADAFDALAPNAVVVSWWSYSTPLWYGQLVDGDRPDIWVVDDRTRLDEHLGDVGDVIEANLDSRPVYVIRLQESEVQALADRYTIEPVGRPGNIYRITGRQESTP